MNIITPDGPRAGETNAAPKATPLSGERLLTPGGLPSTQPVAPGDSIGSKRDFDGKSTQGSDLRDAVQQLERPGSPRPSDSAVKQLFNASSPAASGSSGASDDGPKHFLVAD